MSSQVAVVGERPKSTLPTIALVGVTAVWGSTFVIVATAIETMPVFAFLTWRFGLATLLLVLLRPTAAFRLSRTHVLQGAAIGAVLGLGYILQTIGLKTTPATVSGFITGMFLVFTPLVAWVITRERVPASAWWAVGLATVGLAVLSLKGLSIGIGELLTLVAAIAFAFQIVWLSLWSTPQQAYGLAVIQLGVVTLMCAAAMPFEAGPKVPPSASVWAAVLFLAFAATAVAFVVQTWAQSHLEPTRAAVILTLEPVFAGLAGFLTGEPITWRILLGGAMVLAAMYVVELGPRRGREARVAHLEP